MFKLATTATNMLLYVTLFLAVLNLPNSKSAELPDLSKVDVKDLQSQLPAEFTNTNLTIDDAKNLLRDKCIEVADNNAEAGSKAFEAVETGASALMQCANELLNTTALQIEIERAKPHGDVEEVFNKYCAKRPAAVQCVNAFNDKLLVCLDAEERKHQEVFMHIVDSLLNFICFKDGDQIALFVAEHGPECLESKKTEIQQCLNETLSAYLPKDGLDSLKGSKLPKFVIGERQCQELVNIESCILTHVDKCEDITPSNIVESMFRFIRNQTICRDTPVPHRDHMPLTTASGGISFSSTYLSALWLMGAALLIHFCSKHL